MLTVVSIAKNKRKMIKKLIFSNEANLLEEFNIECNKK